MFLLLVQSYPLNQMGDFHLPLRIISNSISQLRQGTFTLAVRAEIGGPLLYRHEHVYKRHNNETYEHLNTLTPAFIATFGIMLRAMLTVWIVTVHLESTLHKIVDFLAKWTPTSNPGAFCLECPQL